VLQVKQRYHDFFAAGKLARSIWAEACATDEKDAILGVQQARNAMTSCTYLATVSVVLATAGITILFDESKTRRIRQLSVSFCLQATTEPVGSAANLLVDAVPAPWDQLVIRNA
jgi:hypothetical protein